MLIPGRNLETITSARLLWYPHQLVGVYGRLGLAFAIAKMPDRLTEPAPTPPALSPSVRDAPRHPAPPGPPLTPAPRATRRHPQSPPAPQRTPVRTPGLKRGRAEPRVEET